MQFFLKKMLWKMCISEIKIGLRKTTKADCLFLVGLVHVQLSSKAMNGKIQLVAKRVIIVNFAILGLSSNFTQKFTRVRSVMT